VDDVEVAPAVDDGAVAVGVVVGVAVGGGVVAFGAVVVGLLPAALEALVHPASAANTTGAAARKSKRRRTDEIMRSRRGAN
jgi:hypothetical protein